MVSLRADRRLAGVVCASAAAVLALAAVTWAKPDMSSRVSRLVKGTSGNDLLRGSRSGDILEGLGGNDRLYGRAGADRLYGGAGNDRLSGVPATTSSPAVPEPIASAVGAGATSSTPLLQGV